MLEKTTDPWATWEACPEHLAEMALRRVSDEIPTFFSGATLKSARWTALPFYKSHRLIQLHLEANGKLERAYLIDGNDHTWWLNGDAGPLYQVDSEEKLELSERDVVDYLRCFCYFLRADETAFCLLESPDEIRAAGYSDADLAALIAKSDSDAVALWQRVQQARTGVAPLHLKGRDESGRYLIDAAIAYGNVRASAVFAVHAGGEVEMVADEPLMSMDALYAPPHPTLNLDIKVESAQAADDDAPTLASDATPIVWRDREVTEAVVATLLEDAIRGQHGSLLLQHFNSETAADKPIEWLARMIVRFAPIIVIESDIPFVEDFVGGLIAGANAEVAKGKRFCVPAYPGDDAKCYIDSSNFSGFKFYFLSFHAYRSLYDPERTAHELGIKDAAVLIGTDRLSDVPEPLRRLTDLELKFPRINRKLFARIFERVFGAKPSPGWDEAASDWTRYLVPADFHGPRRLGYGPDQALAFLKDRVSHRLTLVSAESGPALSELNGIGEARQIAEDLISDIRAAQASQIPWSSVDRGLLLVGKPGTGKTTLARAIAKECGIKFLVASAPAWQSAGSLDAHLRAMRSDFTEARRFAPSILFIDEIDSIGNRETLSGQNAVYQTDVINALLEQVQGFDVDAPVIVVGATNYVNNVDPALKRAGRLDQIVNIPLPNIDGLESIFEYFLKSFRAGNELAPDVAPRQLAELSFGLTGADVEFFVRGGARRARREGRQITQQDLRDEVTRRPRRPDSAPRLGPEEIRRVAVHEAGHATSSLVGSRHGADLSFITIVPRMDGSLGFVASLPREEQSATRRQMMERLETILAGRAAEEIVYGADDVGLGAGGPSETSDLAVATSVATMLVCQSGLGADNALQWTRQPTPAQQKQIEQLLTSSYTTVLARLRANREVLDEVTRLLVEKQEVSGPDLRSLLAGRPPAVSLPAQIGLRSERRVAFESTATIVGTSDVSEHPLGGAM